VWPTEKKGKEHVHHYGMYYLSAEGRNERGQSAGIRSARGNSTRSKKRYTRTKKIHTGAGGTSKVSRIGEQRAQGDRNGNIESDKAPLIRS